MFRITFSSTAVKRIKDELKRPYDRGGVRAVRRLPVMMIGERVTRVLRLVYAGDSPFFMPHLGAGFVNLAKHHGDSQ